MAAQEPNPNEDIDPNAVLKHVSLNIAGLLCAIRFSKKEVTVRQYKWHMLERTDTLFRQFDNSVRGCVHSGSSSEGMTGGPYYSGEQSDFDSMNILANVKVVESSEEIGNWEGEEFRRCTYLKEIPDIDFPGYVKLIVIKSPYNISGLLPKIDDEYYYPNSLVTSETALQYKLESVRNYPNPTSRKHQVSDSELHGPAVSFKVSQPEETKSKLQTFMIDKTESSKHQPILPCDIDIVACIQSKEWPENARNWISRPRRGHWPENEIIENLKTTPVYLAPVGQKNSPYVHLQWRPSFNIAEKVLVRHFNLTQIHCYALLKIYLKDHIKEVAPDVLSSYCMKTTVFWISEKVGKDFMVPENLLIIFVECLKAIKTWLSQRKLPHYFIESRNALGSNLEGDEISKVIRELDIAILDPVSVLENLKSFRFAIAASTGTPEKFPELITRSFMFAWLEMRCGILERLHFCGTSDLLWAAFKDDCLDETISRYQSIVSGLQHMEYGRPFVHLVQSVIGFLLYAKAISQGKNKSQILLTEAEDLLQKGAEGDSCLCQLKLATFYLGQAKSDLAYTMTSKVIGNAKTIQNRHKFIDNIFFALKKHFERLYTISNLETLTALYDLVITNTKSKTYEELLYARVQCEEAKSLLNYPTQAMKAIAFDVTFLLPEYSALPRAIQQELIFSRINEVQGHLQGIKISPLIYAQYIRFLACKDMSDYQRCVRILAEFRSVVEEDENFYKPRGYNLLAMCYDMLDMAFQAAVCLRSSLQLDPSRHNVAYGYFVVITEILLKSSSEFPDS